MRRGHAEWAHRKVAAVVKKIIMLIVVVIIVVAMVNDVGRYIIVSYTLDETTREATRIAAKADGDRDDAAIAALEYAATQDVIVYAYDENDGNVYVWTESELDGTWFLDSVLLVVQGGSLSESYMIRSESSRPKS